MYVLLGQAPPDAGLWPVASRFTVLVAIALVATTVRRAPPRVTPARLAMVLAVGVLSAAGTVAYLLAALAGSVGIAAVTTELSPVVTALLARLLLAEPLPLLRGAGLALAVAAGVVIAAG